MCGGLTREGLVYEGKVSVSAKEGGEVGVEERELWGRRGGRFQGVRVGYFMTTFGWVTNC